MLRRVAAGKRASGRCSAQIAGLTQNDKKRMKYVILKRKMTDRGEKNER